MLFGLWRHELLVTRFIAGLGKLQFIVDGDDDGGLDEELRRQITFSAVAGKRRATSKSLLNDMASRFLLQVVAITIEVTRYLSGWFMRRAWKVANDNAILPLWTC